VTKAKTSGGSTGVAIEHLPVTIRLHHTQLEGDLSIPTAAVGAVIFAHGSGSSRHSPRNRYVAEILNESRLATLLTDLLTEDEQQVDLQTGHLRFDIPLLAGRLVEVTEWVSRHPEAAKLPTGLFGASTGAAAALVAAAELPNLIHAVVSRGGRPDLAGVDLSRVQAPTLLIVGGADPVVLDLNQKSMTAMRCEHALKVVPGATHLFEERGALEKVAELARDWFVEKLSKAR